MNVEAPARAPTVWTARRRRALELADRSPFAAEQLGLYLALLEVQEPAFHAAGSDLPPPDALAGYVADQVLPRVVEVTAARGPAVLADGALARGLEGDGAHLIAAWLRGDVQKPVDRYLARASAGPVIEALGGAAGLAPDPAADGRQCPVCGGLPQVAYFSDAGEALVTAPRQLVCSRCHHAWVFTRMTCAGCGEQSGSRLPVFGDAERFPHLRIDACTSCDRYLVTVDLRKDPDAVPIVDELAAVPLDLYAREQGKRKIVPNLMGM